ncbi:hypothetical protein BCR44DRAFT_364283 [Catenaria anguillulae PL171]|uniref:Uncharacterized protein n=1 Tax=Catenaria anguillulae PL171 TaxID=765915 RepID=A0A1Y2H7R6_9FUNG|nr:hypothetical protein BCR44DRAFT_364283 [Catenaria anguillulae PL171]
MQSKKDSGNMDRLSSTMATNGAALGASNLTEHHPAPRNNNSTLHVDGSPDEASLSEIDKFPSTGLPKLQPDAIPIQKPMIVAASRAASVRAINIRFQSALDAANGLRALNYSRGAAPVHLFRFGNQDHVVKKAKVVATETRGHFHLDKQQLNLEMAFMEILQSMTLNGQNSFFPKLTGRTDDGFAMPFFKYGDLLRLKYHVEFFRQDFP